MDLDMRGRSCGLYEDGTGGGSAKTIDKQLLEL